jgi:hypothetical protein
MKFYKIITQDFKHPHYIVVGETRMRRFNKDMKYITTKNGDVFDPSSWINQIFLKRYEPMNDHEIAKLLLVSK